MKIGDAPADWAGKRLVYIEPHYDDFILNAYSLWAMTIARKSTTKGLTVITCSHSPVNNQNGMRLIAGKRSTEKIKLVELGFPDFVNDKATNLIFEEKYGTDVRNANFLDLFNYYGLSAELQSALVDAVGREHTLYGRENVVVLTPWARKFSHPYHRIVSRCVRITGMPILLKCYWYKDNPYTMKADVDMSGIINPVSYELSDVDMANRFRLFVENYDHQVQVQVYWYNAWMLKDNKEMFWPMV